MESLKFLLRIDKILTIDHISFCHDKNDFDLLTNKETMSDQIINLLTVF